jgi:uncharacterized protein (TIGR03435 family)
MMRHLFLSAFLWPGLLLAQGPTAPAEARPAFDVASVKPNNTDGPRDSNFPLGPGNVYVPNGGFFSATNQPLYTYVGFAFKLAASQMPDLPDWTRVERFDIQARAGGDPTKDRMRLMMQSLLAERFQLKFHRETRQATVYVLTVSEPGKTGPKLKPHAAEETCTTSPAPPAPGEASLWARLTEEGYPIVCGGLFNLGGTNQRFGARNVPMTLIANALAGISGLDHPVVNETGLTGNFDFVLEWAPEQPLDAQAGGMMGAAPLGGGREAPNAPPFPKALKTQLGLKIELQKRPMEVMVVDHIERPSAN